MILNNSAGINPRSGFNLTLIWNYLILNIPTPPVQALPHDDYQAYREQYDPAAVAYDRGGDEEEPEEEQDPYYHGYPSPLAYGHHGYYPGHSEDVELRSPGVVRRYSRDVIMEESEGGRPKKGRLTLSA